MDIIPREMGEKIIRIDVHCHILAGCDDGARSWDEALAMAVAAAGADIRHVIATPHIMEGFFQPSAHSIRQGVTFLNDRLAEQSIPVTIWPGAEVYLHPELASWLGQDQVVTLGDGGSHLLVELPHSTLPLYTEQVLFDLMLDGITPVIAHPERQYDLARDIPRLADWVQRGMWLQVNAASLQGRYGRTAKRAAQKLVEENLIHCLGSDSHGATGPVTLRKATQHLHGMGNGPELLKRLDSNAQAILNAFGGQAPSMPGGPAHG